MRTVIHHAAVAGSNSGFFAEHFPNDFSYIFFFRRDIDEENLVSTRYVPKLAQRHYQDSDVESDVETSDSEAEEDGRHDHPSQSRDSSQGWLSYCNII